LGPNARIIVTLLTRRHPRAGAGNCVHCECDRLPFLSGYLPKENTIPLNAHIFKPSYLLSASAPHLSDPQDWSESFPCHLPDPRPAVEKRHAWSNCWQLTPVCSCSLALSDSPDYMVRMTSATGLVGSTLLVCLHNTAHCFVLVVA
jgi:hypothetical protein